MPVGVLEPRHHDHSPGVNDDRLSIHSAKEIPSNSGDRSAVNQHISSCQVTECVVHRQHRAAADEDSPALIGG
jgi:hypothetical protein